MPRINYLTIDLRDWTQTPSVMDVGQSTGHYGTDFALTVRCRGTHTLRVPTMAEPPRNADLR